MTCTMLCSSTSIPNGVSSKMPLIQCECGKLYKFRSYPCCEQCTEEIDAFLDDILEGMEEDWNE